MRNSRTVPAPARRLAVTLALAVALAAPLAAATADGLPRLDPTNGLTGTTYTFYMPGTARSLDPNAPDVSFAYRGTMVIFQDPNTAEFAVEPMKVDINGDGVPDRTLRCSGWVGHTRYGMRCSDDDNLGEIRLLMNGRAVVLDSGKIGLRKTTGRGFTDAYLLPFALAANQQ